MPSAGGMDDQEARFVEAVGLIEEELGKINAEAEPKGAK